MPLVADAAVDEAHQRLADARLRLMNMDPGGRRGQPRAAKRRNDPG